MKLSNETKEVLKNFSTINQNLDMKEGSSISIMSAQKNIVAKAKVTEKFPKDFAIYDLNDFLAVLSLFEKPELDFKDSYIIITGEGSKDKATYWYASLSMVSGCRPTKEISMPDTELAFTLSSETLAKVTQASAVVGVPDMALFGGKLMVTDKKNANANVFETPLYVGNVEAEYKFWFKVENLKLMPSSYDVGLTSKNIGHFTSAKLGVQYWIALEPESKYTATEPALVNND